MIEFPPARRSVRSFYSGESSPTKNLGDFLGPTILGALGYIYAPRTEPDSRVDNPGKCLLTVGSLLTREKLAQIPFPIDVWGCGWKGPYFAATERKDIQFHAVRGPRTATGLNLSAEIPLGDPALLIPHLFPFLSIPRHGNTLVIPHRDRLDFITCKQRRKATRCDEVIGTMVRPESIFSMLRDLRGGHAIQILRRRLVYGISVPTLREVITRIAGASFVLTGSLHGAILSQAYGVPWAAYDDGAVDTPAKWLDWADYLGIEIKFAKTLDGARAWWGKHGKHGRIRSLRPLLLAFPLPILNHNAKRLASDLP